MFAPRSELSEVVQDAGAEVLLAPTPLTAAARLVIDSAPLSGWIVQSVRELDALDGSQASLWCMGGAVTSLARARSWPTVEELGDSDSPSELVARLRQALDTAPRGRVEPE
jgi:hypothetical protein